MTPRTVTRALAVATAAATLLAGGMAAQANEPAPPGSASAPPRLAEKLDPDLLEAMERDLGLDAEEAAATLAFQHDAAETGEALAEELDEDFAGTWVEDDVLYVATTDEDAVEEVEGEGATAVTVEHSLADLEAWKTVLDAALEGHDDVPTWYVDVPTNSVVVAVKAGAQDVAAGLVEGADVPSDAVTFVETDETPRTMFDVIGGNAYTIGGRSRCSIGFAVNGGFITAGHCGRTGATTANPTGTFAGSSFPGNDYAFVRTGAGVNLLAQVNNYSGGRVQVAGHTAAPVGSAVCRSGSTTGWHCGTITALNSSVTYPEGTVRGLIRTTVCAEPGDSGGSLLAGNQAQGVTSGGSGNCRTGGTTFFQPVNPILQAYGLRMITTDSGSSPAPAPTSCTGYARTFTGTLAAGRAAAQPNGSYVQVNRSGTHSVCLNGPSGADFDLYVQRWNGSSWVTVAQSTSPGSNETITYRGNAGYYRYVVNAASGSGAYTMGLTLP
ncbi:S1 family peptidase [Cellulomonas bogoriensis]|uniref:Streptogrisin n=3 Tax=Cellulomonas bogoriensis TaxID=301388 RepID=A0A0A0C2W1_9CELL|nr:S1 family peptidase [Cellulomonas bogoriensis]KGM13679.1 streptogrisin [Cellulomonas bogoriensis 69B4 = DSM 16987]CAM33240.1 preprocellulomonadin [Cellulomonas bogoriensis]